MQKRIIVLILSIFSLGILSCSSGSQSNTEVSNDEPRIITVGGSVTEIVYALGAENLLVGTDTSSIFPEAATKLPQVGYQRALSAEGVLSLKPTLLIVLPEAGPPTALEQIENAGVKVVKVSNESTIEGTKEKIKQVAEALNRKKGDAVIKKLDDDISDAEKIVASKTNTPKVIFIYSRGGGNVQVGGTGTQAEAMIKMAGGQNAITDFAQYKPLTAEALVAAQPDVILLPTAGLETMGGMGEVLKLPGIAETPAGKNKKIVSVDDMLLLGFSPRLGLGIKELCEKIH